MWKYHLQFNILCRRWTDLFILRQAEKREQNLVSRYRNSGYCSSGGLLSCKNQFVISDYPASAVHIAYKSWNFSGGMSKILLQNKMIRFVGGLSMEIYLCHMFVY